MPEKIELSIVIPVYDSAKIFPQLYMRLTDALLGVVNSYEILAVVDGCTDESADVIASFCDKDARVKLVELSRNFGEEAAVTAGLGLAAGEMIIVMDDDLEDPPEVIPKFIAKAQEGYEVVYGVIKQRKVSLGRRLSYYVFYRFLNRLTNIYMPPDAGNFCLMKRPVVEALNSMPETNRYIRGMRVWLGFSQASVDYERGERFAGRSGYNIRKYFKFALDGILSFSYKPLQYVSVLGFIIALVSFLLGVRLIVLKLLGKVAGVPGWVSLMVVVLFIGGIQLISIGVVGHYIARIYDEVKRRPKFVIRRLIGFDRGDSNQTTMHVD